MREVTRDITRRAICGKRRQRTDDDPIIGNTFRQGTRFEQRADCVIELQHRNWVTHRLRREATHPPPSLSPQIRAPGRQERIDWASDVFTAAAMVPWRSTE